MEKQHPKDKLFLLLKAKQYHLNKEIDLMHTQDQQLEHSHPKQHHQSH